MNIINTGLIRVVQPPKFMPGKMRSSCTAIAHTNLGTNLTPPGHDRNVIKIACEVSPMGQTCWSYVEQQPTDGNGFAPPVKQMSGTTRQSQLAASCVTGGAGPEKRVSRENKLGAHQGQGHGLMAGLLQHVCMGTLCARGRACLLCLTQYHLGNINDAFAQGNLR